MKIYFETDERQRVLPCCGYSEAIEPRETWLTGEMDGPAYEDHGVPLYEYTAGACRRRSDADIAADIAALPQPEPTEADQLRADVDYCLMMLEG